VGMGLELKQEPTVDYTTDYDLQLQYSRSKVAFQKLLAEFHSPEHKLTRLGQGDPVLRLALAKLLRKQGRTVEAEHLEQVTRPVAPFDPYSDGGFREMFDYTHRHSISHVDPMEEAYLHTALWSSTHTPLDREGNEGEPYPLNRDHGLEDIHPETLGKLLASVHHFRTSLPPHLKEAVEANPSQAGHDLWLTQHGHGEGFHGGGWGEHGHELTKHAQKLPEHNLYAENGQVRE
jgi:hypothetical protein